MRRFLAVRGTACLVFVLASPARVAGAQTWNDPRSISLVERAIDLRGKQLADTGLRDYQARAHGYVTFLAQLGEGFHTPPKIIKSDELESEVYWQAPNQSKQIIVGRRDTLLLPTDIAYHRDHLGIVQNNFPNIIRIGEGDEVRDVPHPLSRYGESQYDYALADSFSIGSGAQRIHVYQVKIRPKADTLSRVVGAVYLDASEGQIVRMDFSFTRTAFLDHALEELSVVLENRLVGGRFWLPSRQEIEIRRSGTWLDYPIRAIISGRWEIQDYKLNLSPSALMFAGPEIVQAPPQTLKAFPWHGAVLDSLPSDVRGAANEDIARVQSEARELVRAQALARAQTLSISARNVADIARFDRAEGLSVGEGVSKQFGHGLSAVARGRYGLDDHQGKGSGSIGYTQPSGFGVRVFASRDYRDVGDVAERSTTVNSIAAQEFGSDYTDPYLVRSVGAGLDMGSSGVIWHLNASYEWQSPVVDRATPVTGRFEPTILAREQHATRVSFNAERPIFAGPLGSDLSWTAELRATVPSGPSAATGASYRTVRASATATLERAFGTSRLVTATTVAGLLAGPEAAFVPRQELVYLGGPITGPGYDYHSLFTNAGGSEHVEWRMIAPFFPFSLGRFGRVPAHGTFAPYVHADVVNGFLGRAGGVYPTVGAGYLLPFDLVRIDVARGLRTSGRWSFSVDIGRDLWSIF